MRCMGEGCITNLPDTWVSSTRFTDINLERVLYCTPCWILRKFTRQHLCTCPYKQSSWRPRRNKCGYNLCWWLGHKVICKALTGEKMTINGNEIRMFRWERQPYCLRCGHETKRSVSQ